MFKPSLMQAESRPVKGEAAVIQAAGGSCMRFAIDLPNGHPCGTPRMSAEFAALVEECGRDVVLIDDYTLLIGEYLLTGPYL